MPVSEGAVRQSLSPGFVDYFQGYISWHDDRCRLGPPMKDKDITVEPVGDRDE